MIFHPLQSDTPRPKRFTYPFCYEPHPLAELAAEDLKAIISHNEILLEDAEKGKMFGVLVVENGEQLGYLAAYSGLLAGRNDWEDFVPPVVDTRSPDGYFKVHEREISAINSEIEETKKSDDYLAIKKEISQFKRTFEGNIRDYREMMAEAKAERDYLRQTGEADEEEELIKESQFMKAELKRLKKRLDDLVKKREEKLIPFEMKIKQLEQSRKQKSEALQDWLFDQYTMLNANGESKGLREIFLETTGNVPPSGAGDCCAPKLLQYAYLHNLKPLCMAEFWWGESPKREVRHHFQYYPACQSKCKPILTHMLKGLDVDPDPLSEPINEELKIVFEDEEIVVVDKPSGMLSVPGKGNLPSVYSLMRQRYPDSDSPLIVHRLDMDTSGLLVVAKTKFSHKLLQSLFSFGRVKKKYVAILSKDITNEHPIGSKGRIELPLAPDIEDRPRQVVDYEYGKPSITDYEIIAAKDNRTLVALYPHTGRTHQLRVVCAHAEGLNAPILGDRLYGDTPAARLYLHAERIEFVHPIDTKRKYAFVSTSVISL